MWKEENKGEKCDLLWLWWKDTGMNDIPNSSTKAPEHNVIGYWSEWNTGGGGSKLKSKWRAACGIHGPDRRITWPPALATFFSPSSSSFLEFSSFYSGSTLKQAFCSTKSNFQN